ncbi:MAG: carboxypeptidase regulatory-like domain-containing protein [Acidobacteriaceae bacterium]|nr:carboxypeptidase regulatory-like domain-containing protein [Acidobacteriaceae bacterium]MBV9778797.1 carboxypeptidase regulatory-like domain-containing protein [Acidobacteriaceae bacterium]
MSLRRSIFSVSLAAICGGLLCGAQVLERQISPGSTYQNAKKYTVTGVVVNSATGEAIRRALVHINGTGQFSCFTGTDGRFQMTDIPEGQVFVTAEKPGFFDQQVLHPAFMSSQANSFTVGPGTNELRVQLVPEARIGGHVVDSEGEPIAQVSIQLLSEEIVEGRKQVQSPMGIATDDDGAYHFDGLVPGRYFLHTAMRPVLAASWANPPSVYPSQYYPAGLDRSTAQPIELRPGDQIEADVTLHEAPAFTISGVIAGAQNGVGLSFEETDGQQTGISSWQFDQRTGHFFLRGVPPGSWTLIFNSNDNQGGMYYARQDVTVSGSDLSDLQVLLQRAADIPVNVNHSSAVNQAAPQLQNYVSGSVNGPAQGPGIQVQLIPSDNSARRFYAAPQPEDAPGSQVFRGVLPGRYRVSAQAFGTECVDSISMGNVDLTRSDLSVAPGARPEPIAVSLRNDCANITGTVRSETHNLQGFALLVPDFLASEPQTMPTQPNGSFSFGGLRPGTYHVYALSDLQGLEYANPEVLKDYAGQQITVGANEKANVTVELIARRSNQP